MKNKASASALSRAERIAGLCYLPFYLVLWTLFLPLLFSAAGLDITLTGVNLCYFCLNFIAVAVIFHRVLLADFQNAIHGFWLFLQALILAAVLFYACNFLVNLLLFYVAPDLTNPNNEAVGVLASGSLWVTALCSVVLGPVTEEALVRGLIFGGLRRFGRIAAYGVSIVLFAAMHLWQYALGGTLSVPELLLCALQYVPAGIALGWAYEKSGNLWCSILLHAAINALSLGLLQTL